MHFRYVGPTHTRTPYAYLSVKIGAEVIGNGFKQTCAQFLRFYTRVWLAHVVNIVTAMSIDPVFI